MTEEDDRPLPPILKQLAGEDLTDHSVESLTARIDALRKEINRAEEAIENKKASKSEAEKYFR